MAAEDKDIKLAEGGIVETITNRVSGKNWKLKKTATVRAQKSKSLRNSWAKRTAERQKLDAVKSLERQLKADKQAEKDVSHIDCL
ncbi:hypothetical protein K492DRAFT_130919 [Lichtheimia hyalospora FSU 10163]|nr:hypothetical protein K492DRAFT_130919 [Lichtheimia hyalospora FSU 10163]